MKRKNTEITVVYVAAYHFAHFYYPRCEGNVFGVYTTEESAYKVISENHLKKFCDALITNYETINDIPKINLPGLDVGTLYFHSRIIDAVGARSIEDQVRKWERYGKTRKECEMMHEEGIDRATALVDHEILDEDVEKILKEGKTLYEGIMELLVENFPTWEKRYEIIESQVDTERLFKGYYVRKCEIEE